MNEDSAFSAIVNVIFSHFCFVFSDFFVVSFFVDFGVLKRYFFAIELEIFGRKYGLYLSLYITQFKSKINPFILSLF